MLPFLCKWFNHDWYPKPDPNSYALEFRRCKRCGQIARFSGKKCTGRIEFTAAEWEAIERAKNKTREQKSTK